MTGASAGLACSRDRTHRPVAWALAADRSVATLDIMSGGRSVLPPLPAGDLAAFDPHAPVALFNDGRTLRGIRISAGRVDWRVGALVSPEVMAMHTTTAPAIHAAGVSDGVLWFASADRKLWLYFADIGTTAVAPTPIPGSSPVVGCDPSRKLVICADGSRYAFGGTWVGLPSLLASDSVVRCVVTEAHVGAGGIRAEGAVVELTERDFLEAVGRGRVRGLRPDEVPA